MWSFEYGASGSALFLIHIVDAVLYRYHVGIPWRDMPERFDDPLNIHKRFSRWAKNSVWERVFSFLAYDADKRVITKLNDNSKAAVIPPKANRKIKRDYDLDMYKARHLTENFFTKLKQFRAIATRYDKTARNFLAGIQLTAAAIWLK